MKLIQAATSVCFGLTCKRFYALHFKNHGMVPLSKESVVSSWYYSLKTVDPFRKLFMTDPYADVAIERLYLFDLLWKWMGPRDTLNLSSYKFIMADKKTCGRKCSFSVRDQSWVLCTCGVKGWRLRNPTLGHRKVWLA